MNRVTIKKWRPRIMLIILGCVLIFISIQAKILAPAMTGIGFLLIVHVWVTKK